MTQGPLVLQLAMAGEAAPFLARGSFVRLLPEASEAAFGFEIHEGKAEGGYPLIVAIAGRDPRFGVDSIGTIPAALLTQRLIDRFSPRLLVNAGTAGGFERQGGRIGDVYLGDEVAVFHDRRIPLDGFRAMGPGHYPLHASRALADALAFRLGIVSTGDSLDCSPEDDAQLSALSASVKDMEAAAIAYVCERRGVPLLLVKAITDIVDHPTETAAQFLANYGMAVTRLADALIAIVARLSVPEETS